MALDATNRLIPVSLSTYTRITAPAPRPLRIPRCHNGFNRIRLRNVTYLTFCFEMEKLNRPLVIDRREMEVAWATFLLKFFRIWEGDERGRIRRGEPMEEGAPLWSEQWEALKRALRDMTGNEVEKYYWEPLCSKLGIPDIDVSAIPLTQWTDGPRPYPGDFPSQAEYAEYLAEWEAEKEEIRFAEEERQMDFYEKALEERREAERRVERLAEEVAGIRVEYEGEGEDEDGDVEMM